MRDPVHGTASFAVGTVMLFIFLVQSWEHPVVLTALIPVLLYVLARRYRTKLMAPRHDLPAPRARAGSL
jgi:membrane protein implicated in regulation of membrane protease activity